MLWLLFSILQFCFAANVTVGVGCTTAACFTSATQYDIAIPHTNANTVGDAPVTCVYGDNVSFILLSDLTNHPFRVQTVTGPGGAAYQFASPSTAQTVPGTLIQVDCDDNLCALGTIFYQCQIHPAMSGTITVTGCPSTPTPTPVTTPTPTPIVTPTPTPTPVYELTTVYQSTTSCDGQVARFAALLTSSCSATACSTSNAGSTEVTCVSSVTRPANTVSQATFSSADCTGNPTSIVGVVSGGCQAIGQSSVRLTCDDTTVTYNFYLASITCSGTATTSLTQDVSGGVGCRAISGVGSFQFQCSDATNTKVWFFAIIVQLSLFVWRLF